ncbi:hypothetical protein CTI12_AA190170 [Artemisia annua]|uniref:Uncharacterized protein n=1 Tax=Artemisia annua TaxID=35608 RepID=A0A2U1P5Q1_ARTAN|nr:hypothetical protein CTI12_AA190170 [Artemisia annua]
MDLAGAATVAASMFVVSKAEWKNHGYIMIVFGCGLSQATKKKNNSKDPLMYVGIERDHIGCLDLSIRSIIYSVRVYVGLERSVPHNYQISILCSSGEDEVS